MRKLFFLALLLLGLAACKKDDDEQPRCCEPLVDILIDHDTITQGNFWTFNIGESAATIYQKIQQTGPVPNITYLGVVANFYDQLEEIETKLALYKSITLRDTVNQQSLNISFEDEKVWGISTNERAYDVWPSIFPVNYGIKKGDAINSVFGKLKVIRNEEKYSNYFHTILMSSKDITKAYEADMSASSLWQLLAIDTGKRKWHINLNFSGGVLVSVSYYLVEEVG